jgi:hypothetical protein
VKVPHEKDFGIDFYCQPRIPVGPQTETVAELCSIQVKGGVAKLAYGGLNQRGEWREYDFTWLRSLVTPQYLAHVNEGFSTVELYSIWPLWWIFWRQPFPFEVLFVTQPAGTAPSDWQDPQSSPPPQPGAAGKSDGLQWTVNLGPPFLQLTGENLRDSEFRQHAIAVLRTWINFDRLMLMRYHQFIPWLTGITKWTTNCPDPIESRTWQFWDMHPGANIDRLCKTAAPMLVSLGVHLQWQNNPEAYELLPVLEWLEEKGHLDPMGKGLLGGLRETKARGADPRDILADQPREGK